MVFCRFVWLPAEGCFIGHPFALCPQDLFDDVPPTTLSAAERRDVAGYLFNFGGGIGGTSRQTGYLHDLVVGNVVAHIHDFVGTQPALVQPFLKISIFTAAPI